VSFTSDFLPDCLLKVCFWQLRIWYCFSPRLYSILSIVLLLKDRKFNEDSKNVLKTVIFLLQVSFTGNFVADCLFKLRFWQFRISYRFSPGLYLISSVFLMLLDRKFNENSKNVLKTVIFLLQVSFTGDFVPYCSFKPSFWQFIF